MTLQLAEWSELLETLGKWMDGMRTDIAITESLDGSEENIKAVVEHATQMVSVGEAHLDGTRMTMKKMKAF